MERPWVLIVDRQLVAEGLARILQEEFTVVGIVHYVSGMMDAVLERRPDIVTLEMSLNGSMAAAARLRQQMPGTRLVFVTHESDRYALTTALRIGAVGFGPAVMVPCFESSFISCYCEYEFICFFEALSWLPMP